MVFLRELIQDQTVLKVDLPDPKGGTSSTSDVARKAFSDEAKYIEWVLSVVENQHIPALSRIHSQLATILRIFNSDRRLKQKNSEIFVKLLTSSFMTHFLGPVLLQLFTNCLPIHRN